MKLPIITEAQREYVTEYILNNIAADGFISIAQYREAIELLTGLVS